MCQCGCAEFGVEQAFELPDGTVVAYGVYRGCDECFSGPGISIYAYPNKKSEWLEGVKIEEYKPDEYGGNQGLGVSVSFFEVRDLMAAAIKIGSTQLEADGYNSVEEWLEDNGLRMMQDAMRIFAERMEELEKRRRKK